MARDYSWVRYKMVVSRQRREHGSSGAASLDAATKQRLAKTIKGWDLSRAIVICFSVYVSDSVIIICNYELKVFQLFSVLHHFLPNWRNFLNYTNSWRISSLRSLFLQYVTKAKYIINFVKTKSTPINSFYRFPYFLLCSVYTRNSSIGFIDAPTAWLLAMYESTAKAEKTLSRDFERFTCFGLFWI
jgi:hypothetical protein